MGYGEPEARNNFVQPNVQVSAYKWPSFIVGALLKVAKQTAKLRLAISNIQLFLVAPLLMGNMKRNMYHVS